VNTSFQPRPRLGNVAESARPLTRTRPARRWRRRAASADERGIGIAQFAGILGDVEHVDGAMRLGVDEDYFDVAAGAGDGRARL